MLRGAWPFLVLLAFASRGIAQEEEQLAAGRRWLDKVARSCTPKLPLTALAGVYFGAKWAGVLRSTIAAAPKESGAAFEITTTSEVTVAEQVQKGRSHFLLGPGLAPISGEEDDEVAGVHQSRKLTVQRGCWRLAVDENGLSRSFGGELQPVSTWEAPSLLFFAVPDDVDVAVREVQAEDSVEYVHRQDEAEQRQLFGLHENLTRYDLHGSSTGQPVFVYADESGRALEMNLPQAGMRILAIDEAAVGKDLSLPTEHPGPVQALLALFRAIKRGDRDAFLAAFDFAAIAARTPAAPEEAGAGETKKETADEVRERLLGALFTEEFQAWLPDESSIENLLGPGCTCTETGLAAEVTDPEADVWRFAQGPDGTWRIIGEGD